MSLAQRLQYHRLALGAISDDLPKVPWIEFLDAMDHLLSFGLPSSAENGLKDALDKKWVEDFGSTH